MKENIIYTGDSLEILKKIETDYVDAIITDPPYELGFMGKSWDRTGITNNVELWKECLRVLKPGGYLLSFGGTRTYHRMASAIEDAGFEVRDMIEWVYGSGFPKSLNIGKAVDKLQGNERAVIGESWDMPDLRDVGAKSKEACGIDKLSFGQVQDADRKVMEITKGTSEWEGWGTALKPAHEPICMARKPLSEKNVAENCLKYGTGGINIDGSRVATDELKPNKQRVYVSGQGGYMTSAREDASSERNGNIDIPSPLGRFPANLIHDNSEEVRECFPDSRSTGGTGEKSKGKMGTLNWEGQATGGFGDSGSASRFFKSIIYTAKASKSERGTGNNHPTVKPIKLMEYLITMVTRSGQIILDPFSGSGTTLIASKNLDRDYIGIELVPEYVKIAENRLSNSRSETI